MNNLLILGLASIVLVLCSCEDVVLIETDKAEPQLIVDAWINNLDKPQEIRLSWSQAYFDASEPVAITGANVKVSGNNGDILNFLESSEGNYTWSPSDDVKINVIGIEYSLEIITNFGTWTSQSTLNRVPPIDSITQEFRDDELFGPDGIYAEFFSRDPEGMGDTYWIKAFKNGEFLNKPLELNIAYDAGFDPGAEVDGLIFITPIRDLINPFDEDEDGSDLSPWIPGDTIYMEIHSLNEDAWTFLDIAFQQINNGENGIFSIPIANSPSNVKNETTNENALGIFCVSAVSSLGRRIE